MWNDRIMGVLGGPRGVFELDNSDHTVGSFIRRQDAAEILGNDERDLASLKFRIVDNVEVIDERSLHTAWNKGAIPNAIPVGKPQRSLNELILTRVMKRAFPTSTVEHQVPVATKRQKHIDLKISVPGYSPLFVEFEGPYHFYPFRPGRVVAEPFKRKREVEDATGIEVVNWPFWIHECEQNVRALFDPKIAGIGALWSTNILFGDFVFDDSAAVIEAMTARFNAVDEAGYGYFYEPNARGMAKPEHFLVGQIAAGRAHRSRLLPRGHEDESRWLPATLRE